MKSRWIKFFSVLAVFMLAACASGGTVKEDEEARKERYKQNMDETNYANTYDLKARPKYTMEALSIHEANPGMCLPSDPPRSP